MARWAGPQHWRAYDDTSQRGHHGTDHHGDHQTDRIGGMALCRLIAANNAGKGTHAHKARVAQAPAPPESLTLNLGDTAMDI